MDFLAYGRQSISEADIEAVVTALRSDFLTSGPMVERFEAALCETCNSKNAISVTSSTAGLHIALMSQNIGPMDAVIVPSITFVATANAVAYCGAQVIFADVDPVTGLMTLENFEDALNYLKSHHPELRFAGVMPVHLTGRMVDLEPISTRTKSLGGFVIEDAAHAIGSYNAVSVVGDSRFSDMTVFSFHPVKTITTGEGGAILCADNDLARRLRLLRSHGIERVAGRFSTFTPAPWIYEQQSLGFNSRLPDINCALGLSQLQRLGEFKNHRQRLINLYYQKIKGHDSLYWRAPAKSDSYCLHLMSILIDFEGLNKARAEVIESLRQRGIGTQVHYIPVHQQPFWLERQIGGRVLVGAEAYYAKTLSLPLHANMVDADVARVTDALFESLGL